MLPFGDLLRSVRESKGMTQKEVAEALGMTPQGYSLYELGKREPRFDIFFKLLKVLDVSAETLLPDYSKGPDEKYMTIKLVEDREPTPFEREAIERYVRFVMQDKK